MKNRLDGFRVLIVEDEYYLAQDLRTALVAEGAAVVGPIGTLSDAVRVVEQSRLDSAVVDIDLHGAKAFPLIERLREADVPVFITTGYDAQSLPQEWRALELFQKPVDPDRIVDRLSRQRDADGPQSATGDGPKLGNPAA